MRGKERSEHRITVPAGITPAHAGKSILGFPGLVVNGDHPRACGEKPIPPFTQHPEQGSPPRMRGKVTERLNHLYAIRITPAHAGKSVFEFPAVCIQ